MTISYCVTACNETETLSKLLSYLVLVNTPEDEIIVLFDKDNYTSESEKIVLDYQKANNSNNNFKVLYHPLNKNYGKHKNYGIAQCSKEFIFQLDGDELPSGNLIGENLRSLIESNPTTDAYAVPRINAWKGLTQEHAKKWGWALDISPTYNRVRAAWPDYQWRIFKNVPYIRFRKRLHEKIEGYKTYAILPADEEWALYHNKTIEKQVETNIKYNSEFTFTENIGSEIFCVLWNEKIDGIPMVNGSILNTHKNWKEIFNDVKKNYPLVKETEQFRVVETTPLVGGTSYNDSFGNNRKIPDTCTHILRVESII